MDKVSPSGAFMIDFLKKTGLPINYFLFNLARSFNVSPSVRGQLNDGLLRYNSVTTIPLAGTRKIGENIGWKQPFVYRPKRYEQFDWVDDEWKIVGEVPEGVLISQRLEFKIRQGARLAEIDSVVYPALSNNRSRFRIIGSMIGKRSYDLDLVGDNLDIRDRVRLTFDVNYVHGLPEWTLQKPRLEVK
ncbi:MAG: hypothetical protein Q7R87_03410 [Nanoarchaeota archaeon]|nr:hypothetical protein [Nanoarchaeota archaeon]